MDSASLADSEMYIEYQSKGSSSIETFSIENEIVPKKDRVSEVYPKTESRDIYQESPIAQNNQLDFSHFTNDLPDNVKILLVYARSGDHQFDTIITVAQKLGWIISVARNIREATELANSHAYDLVIIDRRRKQDLNEADQICSYFLDNDRHDEESLLRLLKIGYGKALLECSHESILMNELVGVYLAHRQPRPQLTAGQLLYQACDRSRDMVHIVDEKGVLRADSSRAPTPTRILVKPYDPKVKGLTLLKNPQDPDELERLLQKPFEWDFDIFKLEKITNKRPLYYLGSRLLLRYDLPTHLNCDESTMLNWLTAIESNYKRDISYHNSTHAIDVLQGVACFMQSESLRSILEPLDEIAALLAAAAHDIDHPGKSSQFLCNARDELAILYNDITVLENHHCALMFQITLSDDSVNIFKNCDRETYHKVRSNVIDMILATEMTKHFEHLSKFSNICRRNTIIPFVESMDKKAFVLPENMTLTKRMIIKCADVSNPTRPFRLYFEWSRRIAEEYFNQTDVEKQKQLPLVMPAFDRTTCSIPKSQMEFIDYIINDMMETWDDFIDMPEIIGNLRENYTKWKILCNDGTKTLEDLEKLQERHDLKLE
uniref:PDEase domain-containing protein n=1 Tax=Trichogramma kaykai TaxID=54128 RepID=A0ABD2VXR4_9HYME